MTDIPGWARASHTGDGRTYDTYRKGSGPGVIIIHEIPGMTPSVIAFAEEVVAAGFTVVRTRSACVRTAPSAPPDGMATAKAT